MAPVDKQMGAAKVSERHYGVVSPDILKSYNGLAFLKAIVAGTVPNPPISETLGFHLAEAEAGRAVFAGTPGLRHYNPIGSVHGGFAATLLDSALACAIFSTMRQGDVWTTLELKINYVRAMTAETGPVRAEGRVIHRGRTVATSEGDLKDASGKLYAHATTTCMIFPAKD
ncbi:MAG TPA: PaaI family thioesterase [Pseudolabrys sp.]|nr:PaaI family thioesterase [Pseudolabrys sp.]